MPIDPKHLPDDPQALQAMVLDLIAQLDREFHERGKIEALLRELLDAKRNRRSERLSEDQLALFAAALQARQVEKPEGPKGFDDDDAAQARPAQVRRSEAAAVSLCRGISSGSA